MKHWLVVELFVPEEFGEAVSNFLMEQGATGIEELEGDSGWERLKTYFPQNGREKRILYALHRYLKSLEKVAPEISHLKIKTASIPEQDWRESWKRFFKPVQVTSRFWVKPPWSKMRFKKGQFSIEINPGMAFGTGRHASTYLCIQALEKRIRGKGLSVLDVGTGSGILSIVAAKLGAREVWGIDTDAVAVENARENVTRNDVSKIVKIRKGSIGHLQKKFHVIVANVDLRGLIRMRRPLLRHLKDQGVLILSGVLEDEKERLRGGFLDAGLLRWINTTQEGEWVCLTFRKGRP